MNVKVFVQPPMKPPIRGTDQSAGWDLGYFGEEPLSVAPGEVVKIRTGTYFQPPPGYFGFLDTRSSSGYKKKLDLMCRTIDRDYTGEVHLIMRNEGKEIVTIQPYERIAQIIFLPYNFGDLMVVNSLEEFEKTERGASGFGHSVGKDEVCWICGETLERKQEIARETFEAKSKVYLNYTCKNGCTKIKEVYVAFGEKDIAKESRVEQYKPKPRKTTSSK